MSEVLRLAGIAKTYNPGTPAAVEVLRDLDLSVARGEVVALVAPSGAGKSTLLHIAGLLDTPDAGTVTLLGRDMTGLPDRARTEARRRQLGFVYQFHHLLPEFTAAENVVLPQLANGTGQGAAQARAQGLLARVGLVGREGHRPAALSGGEQQRVAFCRALANAPALLLADEPTGNLDPATSDQVFAALMEVVRETGLSALIATHNMTLAARMDRVVRLDAAAGSCVAIPCTARSASATIAKMGWRADDDTDNGGGGPAGACERLGGMHLGRRVRQRCADHHRRLRLRAVLCRLSRDEGQGGRRCCGFGDTASCGPHHNQPT